MSRRNGNDNSVHSYSQSFQPPTRMVPARGPKFSDEDPRYRNTEEYHSITRKQKLFVSNKNKRATTELAESFSVDLNVDTKNIRYIKPIQVQITYTATGTPVVNAFLYFPDFTNAEVTASGQKYHAYFTVIQGTAGASVIFTHVFSTNYITEFKDLNNVKGRIRVEVYKEHTDGTIIPFEELTAFATELELNYIDHAFRHDQQVRGI